jgi:hypothetical protein
MKRSVCIAVLGMLAVAMVASPVQAQFIESFESGMPAVGASGGQNPAVPLTLTSGTWFALNASPAIGTTGVFGAAPFGTPPPGAGAVSAQMNFNGSAGAGLINEFLMSPVLTLNNGDVINFQTISINSTFPDRMRLVLSQNGAGTTAGDFTTTLLSINEALAVGGYPGVWTPFQVTLSGLPGGGVSGRFAFNYNIPDGGPNGLQGDLIAIDLVQYTPVPEPTSLALLGIPAAVMVWKRRRTKAAA